MLGAAAVALGAAALIPVGAASASPVAVPGARAGWSATSVPVANGDLTAVAALSETDAWAVGYRRNSLTSTDAVALRWDGTAWKQHSTLPVNSFPSVLAVRSDTDIWAAGVGVEHWDGTAWTQYPLEPDPVGAVVTPDALATAADGTVWLAGEGLPAGVKDGVPVVEAWNGTAWKRQTLPALGKGALHGIAAVAPNDVWAAGVLFATGPKAPEQPLLLHWDGTTWSRVALAGVPGAHTWVSAVTAFGPADVWAVGASTVDGVDRPFAAHWNGQRWVATATPAVPDGRLRAIGRTGEDRVWALGGKGGVSLALQWEPRSRTWRRASDPGIVVRGFATVPASATMWAVGLTKRGNLVPTAIRYRP